MDDALRAWVEEVVPGRVVAIDRPGTGGSRTQFFVDVERDDGTRVALVLRCEEGGAFSGTAISPAKEATVYRALMGTTVPVPRVVGSAPGGAALLLERVAGTGDLARLPESERRAALADFVAALADLHSLPAEDLDLPGFARPSTPAEHATIDLAAWARLADDHDVDVDPLVRYAGAWLRAHPPATVHRTVLVQGDTGPGNFVADEGRVTGIVDWEFAHLGDPMDDWAWLRYRCSGDLRGVLDELETVYTARSGIPVDDDAVGYYELAVQYRCAVTTSLTVARGGGARGFAPYLLATERYVLGVADQLARRTGVREEPIVPAVVATARTERYDALIEGLRAASRAIEDPQVRERTRDLQILVHHLRGHDAVGAAVADADRADCRATLGVDALGGDAGRALLDETGARGDEAVLRYLLRRTARERVLWATLLDRVRR